MRRCRWSPPPTLATNEFSASPWHSFLILATLRVVSQRLLLLIHIHSSGRVRASVACAVTSNPSRVGYVCLSPPQCGFVPARRLRRGSRQPSCRRAVFVYGPFNSGRFPLLGNLLACQPAAAACPPNASPAPASPCAVRAGSGSFLEGRDGHFSSSRGLLFPRPFAQRSRLSRVWCGGVAPLDPDPCGGQLFQFEMPRCGCQTQGSQISRSDAAVIFRRSRDLRRRSS